MVTPSPDRVDPPCPHFGQCGGCVLQHWAPAPYAVWKRGLLAEAIARAGFDADRVAPLVPGAAGQRRRMDLAARRVGRLVAIGLHPRNDPTRVVDFVACPVLHPDLFRLIDPLRVLLGALSALRKSASVVANLLDGGPDLLLRTDGALTASDRTAIAGFATAHGLVRVSWARENGAVEPAFALGRPTVSLHGAAVAPPPGAFLQATASGEASIVAAVLAGLPDRLTARSRITELFAGCGTLTFPLAERAKVRAFEGDPAALAALRQAAGGRRIETVLRDLTRQPVMAAELADSAAVVLDPPHTGAAAQMPQIAAAGVSTVIYVSCNPATFGRDVALLSSNFELLSATPIDQFLWSARVESVNVFARRRPRRSIRRL